MKMKPLFDKVILKPSQPDEKTKSGIILAGSAKEKPQISEVMAVGPGGLVGGENIAMVINVGDKVVVNKYAGTEITLENETCIIVSQSEILAVIE